MFGGAVVVGDDGGEGRIGGKIDLFGGAVVVGVWGAAPWLVLLPALPLAGPDGVGLDGGSNDEPRGADAAAGAGAATVPTDRRPRASSTWASSGPRLTC